MDDVLATFIEVRKKIPAKLLLVGDGPDRSRIEKRAEELGYRNDVICIGKIKNPIEPLRISDLFLLPSETESFGLAALEAMASGVPVIASNTGGLPEVIEHGVSGFLHEVGDTQAMANSALDILGSPLRLEAFRKQAKARSEVFHIDAVLPQYEGLYNRLVSEKKALPA